MKIDINKKQYETLVQALEISTFIYGPLSDCTDKKYKNDVDNLESVSKYLLSFAKEFDFEKNIEVFENEHFVKEKYWDKILDDLSTYDDQQLYLDLANKLGWRDFKRKFTEKEIKKMSEEHGGYLGVPIYDFEKKYYDEFDEHEYDRLEIKE